MTISVIIPTLNEEICLDQTLGSLVPLEPTEILVADGGSQDATIAIARHRGAKVLIGPKGRSLQMNMAARQARGDVLLFLHADCHLEIGAFAALNSALNRRRVVAGCFIMKIDASGLLYRCIEQGAIIRTKLTGLIYGDQGLFIRRSLFESMGGFAAIPFLEDVELSGRLRREGQVEVANAPIHVSPRRSEKKGIVRQTLQNWTLLTMAGIGFAPRLLAGFYEPVR